jgi:hypothetical protein
MGKDEVDRLVRKEMPKSLLNVLDRIKEGTHDSIEGTQCSSKREYKN